MAKTANRSIDPPKLFHSPEFSRRSASWENRQLRAPKTGGQMIVDYSDRLHIGIDDGRADETEAPKLQVLADRVGQRRAGRRLLHASPEVLLRTPVHESPQICVERAEFPSDLEERARVADRRFDLETVAHDSRNRHQTSPLACAEEPEPRRGEAGEGPAIIGARDEDRRPR